MSDPNDWIGYAALFSLVLIVIGAWTMHQRLRTRSSLVLLSAISALVVWVPLSSVITSLLLFYNAPYADSAWLNYSVMTVEIILPALLLLLAAGGYLLACQAIPLPNQSFKPTSLRDAA